jgi:predicted MFS family arabinose efflux permease
MSVSSTTPPAAQGRAALIVTLAIQSLGAGALLTGPVLAPLAAPDVGVEAHLIGIYVAASYLCASIASLMSGGLMARFGPLRASQAGLVCCAAGLALGTLDSPLSALASAALVGFGYGPITPSSSQILIRTTAPARLNLVFSLKQTGVPIGGALAGAVLPSLAEAIRWHGAVLATAACCLAVALAAEPLRRSLDVGLRRQRLFSLTQIFGPLAAAMRSPMLRLLAFTAFAYAGMQMALSSFLVTYLSERLGMSVPLAGAVLAAALVSGVAGRVLWGFLADRMIDPLRLLGVLGLIMSACAVMVGLFTRAWPLAAIVAIVAAYGATAISWNGVQLAQVARFAPPGRAGETTGATTFVTFQGVALVPFVFSLIIGSIGSYFVAYSATAVLTLASGIAYLVAARAQAAAN